MNIQDLGAIGEFISSITIVITLIILTVETRRARNATQQTNRQGSESEQIWVSLSRSILSYANWS